MPLIHSGPSTLRIGVTLVALLMASAVSAQEPAAVAAPEAGAPPALAPQVSTTSPSASAPSARVVPTSPDAAVPPVTTALDAAAPGDGTSASTAQPIAPTASPQPVEAGPVEAVAVNDALPHDLSPVGMFMAADWIVKGVMIALGFASLVTWTVWLAKTLQLFGARARATRGLKAVLQAKSLKDALAVLEKRGGVVASMVRSAQHEMTLSDGAIDRAGAEGVKERVASALGRIEVRAGRQMSKGTGVLASIGSTAPFVGLFGTVWGIMNSFIGIAETQTTNLAVVAPGIAEALLATAVGLVAAIPAVIIYNVFARSVTGYRQLVSDAAAGIERLVSRDLDFRKSALSVRASNLQAAE